jgi:hypothetical protein
VDRFVAAYAAEKFDGLWLIAMPLRVSVVQQTAVASERMRPPNGNGKELAATLQQLPIDPPFIFVYGGMSPRLVRELSENINDSCVIVSATEMAKLIRQWKQPAH